MFRVVPDQLRISDGWVRCGHCAEVFDASAHLQTQVVAVAPTPPPSEQLPLPVPAAPAAALATAPLAQPEVPTPAPPVVPPAFLGPPAAVQEVPTAAAPAAAHADAAAEEARVEPTVGAFFAEEPVDPPGIVQPETWSEPTPEEMRSVIFAAMQRPSADIDAPAPAVAEVQEAQEAHGLEAVLDNPPASHPLAQVDAAALASDAVALPAGEEHAPRTLAAAASAATATAAEAAVPAPAIGDMSFVRAARRKAMWSRPAVRWGLSLVCLLLFAALALQITLQERDRIAAIDARTRPWLEQLCLPLGCRVAPLKRIESIVIESSGFNKVRGNAYRLTLSLRNKGTVPLAMPGVELALTDNQDQPVLRRVLLPADMGAAEVLAPGAEWNASLPVSVALNGPSARIAGYRLLAFYP